MTAPTYRVDPKDNSALTNSDLVQAAAANDDFDAFKNVAFRPVFLNPVINQENANAEVFRLILPEGRMRELIIDYVARNVYDRARAARE